MTMNGKSASLIRAHDLKINFVLTNMSKDLGQPTLEDPLIILSGAFTDLGIEVAANGGAGITASNQGNYWLKGNGWVNLIFDGFDPVWLIPEMKRARTLGARIFAIETEEPGAFAFNHAGPNSLWAVRKYGFELACKEQCFDGVLYFVPHGKKYFEAQHPNAAHIETGYSVALDNPSTLNREFSFVFCGGMGDYRENYIQRVHEKLGGNRGGHIVARQRPHTMKLPPRAQRDEILRRGKFSLNIKPHELSRIISGSRCAWSLLNGVPVVSQYIQSTGSAWPDIITMPDDRKDFVEMAVDVLPYHESIYRKQREAFIRLMSPERVVLPALQKLGLFGGVRSKLVA